MCALIQPEEWKALPGLNRIQNSWNTWRNMPSIVKKMERSDAFSTLWTIRRST